jgi:hypothetical protein
MDLTTRMLGHSQAANGPSNEDILRWRWDAMGIPFTDAKLQAAARNMDEYDARMAKEKAEAESPDEDEIDEAWEQVEEERSQTAAPARCQQRESESVDDILLDLGEAFAVPSPASNPDDLRGTPAPAFTPEEASGKTNPAEMIAEAAAGVRGTRRKKHSRELNYRCKGYKTNDALANCHDINDKVRATLAIINGLMSDKGFCYCSDEQLAIWMHMSVRGAKNLLNKLVRKGFIIQIGFSGSNIKRVVRPDLANNSVRTQSLIDDFANIN